MKVQISLIAKKNNRTGYIGEANKIVEVNSLNQLAELTVAHHWTPGVFKDVQYLDKYDQLRQGRRRTLDNCESIDLMVADVDKDCTLDEAIKKFSPYRHIIVTSRSHQKKKHGIACDRFRVILFLEKPISNERIYAATWFNFEHEFPFIDPQCKDISRFYWAGNEIIHIQSEGKYIQVVDNIKEIADIAPSADTSGSGMIGALSTTTKSFLLDLPSRGQRHGAMIKALIDMKEQGFSEENARERCQKIYSACHADWGVTQEARIVDIYRNKKVKYPARWPVTKKTKTGKYIPDKTAEENYVHLIKNLMDLHPKYNLMSQSVELIPNGVQYNYDIHLSRLCARARAEGLISSKDAITDYLNIIAEGAVSS